MFGKKTADVMIQIAGEEDLPRIAEIHMQAFSRGWSRAELMGMLSQPGMVFLVARHVGKPKLPIAGFNIMRQTADEAEIISVAVDRSQGGRQIGKTLMRHAISMLQADRVPSLFLEVADDNETAVQLYKKLGFSVVGQRPAYYNKSSDGDTGNKPDRTTALVMRLDLV